MKAYRAAARALGLCPECRTRKATAGFVLCGACRSERARRKRMARRIGSRKCPCGEPAVNVRSGVYICAGCQRKDAALYH